MGPPDVLGGPACAWDGACRPPPEVKTARLRPISRDVPLADALLVAALACCLLALAALRRRAARDRRDLRDLRATATRLRHLADHDMLTGLPNRRRFEQELERHLAHGRRYGAEGAVLLLDVDRFKPVNDTHGHAAGDRLLAHVACVLRERLRATDVVARLGGDEFAVLLPRADRAGAEAVARSLVATVRAQAPVGLGGRAAVTISAGVLVLSDCAALDVEDALAAADLAMYDAKTAGGDGWAPYAVPAVYSGGGWMYPASYGVLSASGPSAATALT